MNELEDDKLEAFADFEQLPSLDPVKNPQKILDDPNATNAAEAAFTKSLTIALTALNGDFSIVLNMPPNDRLVLIAELQEQLQNVGLSPGAPAMNSAVNAQGQAEEMSPSAQEAATIVQTPEEKAKEQEFLDLLDF